MSMGQVLRGAREHAGITQQELADRLGCTQPAVSQMEASNGSLTIGTIQRFLDVLGCDLQLVIVSRQDRTAR